MPDSPRETWESTPEPDPAYQPPIEPYAPNHPTGTPPQAVDWNTGEAGQRPQATPFTVLSATELLQRQLPPRTSVLGDGVIALGQLTTVIGQGGTGKSRFVMQVAIAQILGLSVAGLTTHPEPLRHLLIGTENSVYRQQHDLRKMTSKMAPGQIDTLGGHLFFHVIDQVDDAFIHIGSDDIRRKWLLTLEDIRPDCIYIDPFGEVNIGDINKDADVRHTLRELTKICRRHNQDSAIVLVHHARTGRHNIAQAVGWDKANFALGSKALYSGSRCQINLAPADPDDSSRIVVSCGKFNDGKPFDPVGLRLDEDTMRYEPDESFDLGAWKDDVEGKVTGQVATIKHVIDALRDDHATYNAICQHVIDASGCSLKTAKRRLTDALDKDYVRKGSDNRYHITQKSLTL